MALDSSPNNAAEIDRLALALVKDPASKAFIPLAEEYGKAGMWAEAAGVLEDGLKQYPGFITAMVALGRVYSQLNQPAKAKTVLEEAVKASPENLRAHRILAKMYAAEGAVAAALKSCAVILAANPADQESLAIQASLKVAQCSTAPAPQPAVQPTGVPVPAPPVPPASITESMALSPSLHAGQAPSNTESSRETVSSAALPADIVVSEPALDEQGNFVVVVTAPADEVQDEAGPDQADMDAVRRRKAAIVRLDTWLQLIRTRRRDRPASGATERAANG